jgi:hypothetical protein
MVNIGQSRIILLLDEESGELSIFLSQKEGFVGLYQTSICKFNLNVKLTGYLRKQVP